MNFKESFAVSIDALRSNKMRSVLTTLGIIIGVATIIGMMSIIQGLQNYMAKELSVLGSNTFQIQKDPPVQFGHLDERYRNRKNITLRQADEIKERARLVKSVGPETAIWGQVVKYGENKTNPDVVTLGVTQDFQIANNYFISEGRFVSDSDVEYNRPVVVLGLDIVEKLFPHSSAIGEYVRIGPNKFKVIGISEKQGALFGQSRDNLVLIPITTFHKIFGDKRSVQITIQVKDADKMNDAIEEVTGILRILRKVPPDQENDFEVFTSETLIETFNDMSRGVKIGAIFIAAISLVVGGIGIMNIMLVSVTERTREIGIRKAVGARRLHILWQFLTEAIILGNLGGIIGIIIGVSIGVLAGKVSPLPTAIPIWAVFLGIGFCSVVGIIFGVYPASKAARLDPIVALRYE
ncbi:MAG: ABC transporter permease [bacterium]|jgi:putative ABC transport system permease protein|nr:ABC transporter permease [bacterium]